MLGCMQLPLPSPPKSAAASTAPGSTTPDQSMRSARTGGVALSAADRVEQVCVQLDLGELEEQGAEHAARGRDVALRARRARQLLLVRQSLAQVAPRLALLGRGRPAGAAPAAPRAGRAPCCSCSCRCGCGGSAARDLHPQALERLCRVCGVAGRGAGKGGEEAPNPKPTRCALREACTFVRPQLRGAGGRQGLPDSSSESNLGGNLGGGVPGAPARRRAHLPVTVACELDGPATCWPSLLPPASSSSSPRCAQGRRWAGAGGSACRARRRSRSRSLCRSGRSAGPAGGAAAASSGRCFLGLLPHAPPESAMARRLGRSTDGARRSPPRR